MKANAPEKIQLGFVENENHSLKIRGISYLEEKQYGLTEYIRTDAFIEKARNWFEQQPELYDANGVRVYGEGDFEDFVNYMKGE